MSLFITGTDTSVGKTYITAMLLRALRKEGIDAVGFKPICCGERSDAEMLRAACDNCIPLNDVNPVWLRAPAAPYAASLIENRPVDLDLIERTYRRLCNTHRVVLVEGVGGWAVPVRRDYRMSDLAKSIGLPVAVVVPNRLGALNHTILTVEALRAARVPCRGLLLNGVSGSATLSGEMSPVAASTNRALLEEILDTRVILEVCWRAEGIDGAAALSCLSM